MAVMETKKEKLHRQFILLCDYIDNSMKQSELNNAKKLIPLFEKENQGVFIVNNNPDFNEGYNFTCKVLADTLRTKADSRMWQIPIEHSQVSEMLSEVNEKSKIKITIK